MTVLRMCGLVGLALLAACGMDGSSSAGEPAADGGRPDDRLTTPGTKVTLSLSSDDQQELSTLSERVDATKGLTADALLEKYAVAFDSNLGYDPSQAQGLAAIQRSSAKLKDDELARLARNGFVVSARNEFPAMLYAYASYYVQDLPLFVSADSILDSVHRSYDAMLKQVELSVLVPNLTTLLEGMRTELKRRGERDQASLDADFYVSVALGLLKGQVVLPSLDNNRVGAEVRQYVTSASRGSGHSERVIFGARRDIDWSQFTPRGHYTDSPALANYFRAMQWLGRIEMRMIETQSDGSSLFHRRQLETILLLRDLIDADALASWQRVDSAIEAFVGTSDYMRLPEVDTLLQDLGVRDAGGLASVDDETIAQIIIDKGYGSQRIASQLIVNQTPDSHTLPLDRSFALFGQRYVVDSHVFSNVVYDRIPALRLMPNPLDVAFAALGNDAAAPLLSSELHQYDYAAALDATRTLVDAHDASFWDANLYNLWLGSLRTLSPAQSAGLPSVAKTDAWSRRVLTTQLASWAELRHNTVLYAKQSYTSGLACAYPNAYVDPYPEFYARLSRFAERGDQLAELLAGGRSQSETVEQMRDYFANLKSSMDKLQAMATEQQTGSAFTPEQLAFINDAVHEHNGGGCVPEPSRFDGWFAKLHFGFDETIKSEFDPTITDVHTQPTDEGGGDVGRILHVGTGMPRQIVVTADSCEGPHAYVGVTFSYYEQITENWKRLTDEDWKKQLSSRQPADVEWASE